MGPENHTQRPLLGGLYLALLAAGLPLCALLATLAPSWPVPVGLVRPPCWQQQPRPPREAPHGAPRRSLIRLVGLDPSSRQAAANPAPEASLFDLAADRRSELPW